MALRRPRTQQGVPPKGEMRPSQLLSTYGAGAMVDLLDDAVLVSGLDFWRYGADQGVPLIAEPRLRDDLARRLGAVERKLSFAAPFRAPPTGDGRQLGPARGISVLEFPRWFVCQGCRALLRASDGLNASGGHYLHDCDGAAKPVRCVPMRFVGACVNGHLDDFPWVFFTHEQGKRCEAPSLRFLEGTTGDFSEMRGTCVCGETKPLFHATVTDTNPPCQGERPWLGPASRDPVRCTENVRLLVRSASNGYFSQVESALSLPEDDSLLRAVESVRTLIATATDQTLPIFRQIEAVKTALARFSDEAVLGALAASTRGPPKREPPGRGVPDLAGGAGGDSGRSRGSRRDVLCPFLRSQARPPGGDLPHRPALQAARGAGAGGVHPDRIRQPGCSRRV